MFKFEIFGIPVVIHPLFWLTSFLLGGGGSLATSGGSSGLTWILVWMVVVFFSILVHELGHALTARKLSGGHNHIKLWAMGGLAYHEGTRQNRFERLWTIIMGPAAGLALFALTCAVIVLLYGPETGLGFIRQQFWPEMIVSAPLYKLLNSPAGKLFDFLIFVNFWWSLVNLLPVFPLDGGQFFAEWTGKRRLANKVGAFTGILVAVVAVVLMGRLYVGVLFGFLAFQNIMALQDKSIDSRR